MEESEGQPEVREGTPPTPDNPYPSNQVVTEYPDGSVRIETPPPTVQVLDEYEEAIANWPDDAGLRLHYSRTLQQANLPVQARKQAEEAIRLRPDWAFPHNQLAALLSEFGLHDAALCEYRAALQLLLAEPGAQGEQGEAISRWCIAGQLQALGRVDEAREELEQAVAIMYGLVATQQRGEQLLEQLEQALAAVDRE